MSPVLSQLGDDLVERVSVDIIHGPAAVDTNDVDLVFGWRLENRELAMDHGGAHVVALALSDALQEDLLGGVEVDEVDLKPGGEVGRDADDVSVLALQGGAGNHDAVVAKRELLEGLLAEAREPVPAVGVCEGGAGAHLFDVLGRVKLFAWGVSHKHTHKY